MKKFLLIIYLIFYFFNIQAYALEYNYPDYAYIFLGEDKHENYNRKMFSFNTGLNKYVIKPIHIVWASILPQYAMDRIYGVSNNIEFPIRLISSLVQRDFHNAGNETKRFLINTTIGLAGMYDPAKHFFKLNKNTDNMDKALSRCNIKAGTYFVAPVINFTTGRDLFGRVLDVAFNPTTYIGSPILAAIKAGITINRTSYIQSVIYLVESNFADPYTIFKIAFGIDGYIKKNNYDRVDIISEIKDDKKNENKQDIKTELNVSAEIIHNETEIQPDIYLTNYAPQAPVIDSMRTSLFVLPEVNKSIWNDFSIWNHSFARRIKTSSVNIFEGRDDYTFRYILQKENKNSPLAIIYPSTGDGVKANHPIMFAKMFYDQGYSVIIQGNPFQWEFVKSMPEDYRPGLPEKDAYMMLETTNKIIEKLQNKYDLKFEDKVVLGTSLAGLDVLFMAEKESRNNTLGKTKFISICPPIDLMYAITQLDNYVKEMPVSSEELQQKVAYTSAKIVKLYQEKDNTHFEIRKMPFDEYEAKILTSFLMHQKLSDVIFTIENTSTKSKTDIYNTINQIGFVDYVNKYILSKPEIINYDLNNLGLLSLKYYLENNDNYNIYHTTNDYLINQNQLKQLKTIAKDKLTIFDNGSHMGFLYREEFLQDLKHLISTSKNQL